MVNIALHISLKNFEQQRNGRAYPAIIPTAHVIAPYHCFQLFCRVIRTSSAVAVKQLVRYTIRLLGLCVIPTARGEKSCRFIREIPLSWSRLFSLFSRFASLRSYRISSARLIVILCGLRGQ